MPTTVEALLIILFVATPGYLTRELISLFRPRQDRTQFETIVDALVLGTIILLFSTIAVYLLGSSGLLLSDATKTLLLELEGAADLEHAPEDADSALLLILRALRENGSILTPLSLLILVAHPWLSLLLALLHFFVFPGATAALPKSLTGPGRPGRRYGADRTGPGLPAPR